jgi:hypothetical protein
MVNTIQPCWPVNSAQSRWPVDMVQSWRPESAGQRGWRSLTAGPSRFPADRPRRAHGPTAGLVWTQRHSTHHERIVTLLS